MIDDDDIEINDRSPGRVEAGVVAVEGSGDGGTDLDGDGGNDLDGGTDFGSNGSGGGGGVA